MRNRIMVLAALAALCLVGGGCGGSGSPAPGAAQAPAAMSVPRTAGGIQFVQYADKQVYHRAEPITITFVITNQNALVLAENPRILNVVVFTAPLSFPIHGIATGSDGSTSGLLLGSQHGGGVEGDSFDSFYTDYFEPSQVAGFSNTITGGLTPGTWTIKTWLNTTLTAADGSALSAFPAGSQQTTEYANPITIRVLP